MKSNKYLLSILTILSVIPVVCLASERTVLFRLRNDSPVINSNLAGNKSLGHAGIIQNLREASTVSQSDFVNVLENSSKISSFKPFWIANIVKVTGDSAELDVLAARSDVESAVEDLPIELITPVEIHEQALSVNGPESSLVAINAPQAWALGLDGTGSLVCSFDTGVEGTHSALSSKYRGNNGGAPAASWYDPSGHSSYPIDLNGHGTHTMGTMIGSENGDTVGVAPGAQWIAAAVVDRGGGVNQTISDILAGFEWAADPDGDPNTTDDVPDVLNNSWGIPLGYFPPCEATFWEAIDNLEAAGVVCLFAAGNEGPNASSIRIPADRIASALNSFSVGAVDGAGQDFPVANFSSRGPSACDYSTIKPEVTAPGVGIRSTSRTGGYTIMSGTSMATPHVAGAVAILRQFNPQATPTEIKLALMNSALDLGQPGEDNDYGWGLIDIRRAIDYMPTPSNPFIAIASSGISGDGLAVPGGTLNFGIILDNLGADAPGVRANLTCSDSRVQILSGAQVCGPLAHGDSSTTLTWSIVLSDNFTPGENISLELNITAGDWTAQRNLTIVISDLTTPVINP
ncbi:MAG TPA: hypothetical protein DCZ43_08170, partial [candidate division Zixibacteria bacterium]|nr:hypothetical protein [candidate division Zixibacteria bacterium]